MWQRFESWRARRLGLRCRPGDVCWVRRDLFLPLTTGERILAVKGGTVVRVVALDAPLHWLLETAIEIPGINNAVVAISDAELIPLRDRPGQDETLRETPKPLPLVAVAERVAEKV